jgi:thiol:disulfide interchange protein DsbD
MFNCFFSIVRVRAYRVATQRAVGLCLMALMGLLGSAEVRAADDFLEPDAAFHFSARMQDGHTVVVTYDIANGYYMYRAPFKFSASGAKLGVPQLPAGKVKFDETFQKNVETYRHSVTITIPVEASGMFTLTAIGQGCADAGLCYAPQEASARLVGAGAGPATGAASMMQAGSSPQSHAPGGATVASTTGSDATVTASVGLPNAGTPAMSSAALPASASASGSAQGGVPGAADLAAKDAIAAAPSAPSELGGLAALLGGGRLLAIIPAFILLGLGLAFTPCVLPMVPILSSIIVGEGARASRARGLLLSLAYSLGMAMVYTGLGVAAGLAGEGLAAALQNPWVLGAIGLLIVGMALSMFGVYELQLPGAVQTRLADASGRQSSGKLAGVFVMGALSALIVGPCVAAPLAGALVYISQTRDVVIGGAALFAMAMGMSIPLLLVGVSAGSLLPRAGRWMGAVKRFFGVLMLAMALWLVAPVLPAVAQMLGWSALLLGYGVYLLRASGHWAAMAFGAAFALLGAVQLVGVASGGRDALAPLAHLRAGGAQAHALSFKRVKTVAQLDAALAATGGKTAMLDFYADWCVSCKEMEKLTFVDPRIQARLAQTLLLQVDVTANDADDKAMLKRFKLFGPPGIILFDRSGAEIADSRVIGYQNPDKVAASLARLR